MLACPFTKLLPTFVSRFVFRMQAMKFFYPSPRGFSVKLAVILVLPTCDSCRGWSYKPVDGSKWFRKCSKNLAQNLNKCIKKCPSGSIIVANEETGSAYCWEPGTGQWEEDGGDDHVLVKLPQKKEKDLPVDEDGDVVEPDSCVAKYRRWNYIARGDDEPEEDHTFLINCIDECDEDNIIVGKNMECTCWEEEAGQWSKEKGAVSWVQAAC